MTLPELRGLLDAHARQALLPAASALYRAASGDPALRDAVLTGLDELIRVLPTEDLGPVALLAGALVESGADPTRFPPAVFDALLELLGRVAGEGTDDVELPEAFYRLEQAAMACLSRSAELRRSLPQKDALNARIRRYSERYGFLGKMLRVLDDEPLVALHPPSLRAFRFEIGGIADNFQLHALLRGALAGPIPGERPTDAVIAAFRDGPATRDGAHSDWQLCTWRGLLDPDDRDAWVWNEGVPDDVPPFEGERLLIVNPSRIRRGWNSQRLFDGMPGRLTPVGELPRDDSAALVGRIRAALAPR